MRQGLAALWHIVGCMFLRGVLDYITLIRTLCFHIFISFIGETSNILLEGNALSSFKSAKQGKSGGFNR